MATQATFPEQQDLSGWAATQDRPGETRSLTRQPILDEQGGIFAYELFAGIGPRTVEGSAHDARMIIDDLVLFGAQRLSRGFPVLIRCDAEALVDRLPELLPPASTIVGIPMSLEVTEKLVEACFALRQSGYRLALVDCLTDPEQHPLLDLVDYVKADFLCMDANTLANLRRRLEGKLTALIAEHIEWKKDLRPAAEAGFSYFQGSSLGESEPLRFNKVPANRAAHINILQQLFPDPLNVAELIPLLKRDPSIVYRLLRLVNSPICPMRRKVDSLQQAIFLLGEDTVRRATMLAIECELAAEPSLEPLRRSLVRAHFCELAAPLARLDSGEQYLLGMFSMLPEMLHAPASVQALDLSLPPAVVEALLGSTIPESTLLEWIEALERNLFSECSHIANRFKLDREKLESCYMEAVHWVAEAATGPQN